MSAQYTPGPWEQDETWGLIVAPGGAEIAACHGGRTGAKAETKANASLIAASLDGYELLASMREWAEGEADDPASEDRPFAVKILAYLAKAEGR